MNLILFPVYMTMLTFGSAADVETISQLNFKNEDVLPSNRERIKRRAGLLMAVALESIDHKEVVLTVEDQSSTKKLRSRILGTSDHDVLLEKGLRIPIRSIWSVEFQS
ncbi:MAG: hypothetical protein SH856_03625 [Flavobacteriales bacterium]|nr:hypothetical protein [Flavobacteriales bacterium]